MSELTHHAAHLKHGEAQINGAADWHNRTGGTLPAKLSCYEAVAVSAELARLRAEVERLTKQNRDEESWWKEKHDYQARAERFEAELKQMQSSALTWARFAAVKADGEDVAKQRAERAEADKARLDWLERNGRFGYKAGTVWSDYYAIDLCGGEKTTLRAAIDAAMNASEV